MENLKNNTQKNIRGFTLVEIAVVIVISALLLSMLGGYLNNAMSQSKRTATDTRIAVINGALKDYITRNNRLPKPANRNVAVNTSTYAREIIVAAAAPGVLNVPGTDGRRVLIGAVPTRTINLPDEYAYDGWGSRIVYAVTDVLTQTSTFNLANGAIAVEDSGGNSMITPVGSGTFLLLSPGPDREDGYNTLGLRAVACTGAAERDGLNCDGNNIFVDTLSSSDTDATQFDDHVEYEANFNISDGMPPGAIMAFNGTACPPGWSAISDMAGRVIIGSGPYVETAATTGLPSTANLSGYSGQSYALGGKAGWATRFAPSGAAARINNMPPYKVYLYCEKAVP